MHTSLGGGPGPDMLEVGLAPFDDLPQDLIHVRDRQEGDQNTARDKARCAA